MSTIRPLLLILGMLLPASDTSPASSTDPAHLRELLYDRHHPRTQSTAALLLLQLHTPEADEIIRQGLKRTDSPEIFYALTTAIRMTRDLTYVDDLLAALASSQGPIRQSAAETLGELADSSVVLRIQAIVENLKADPVARQAGVLALGRSGQKSAIPILFAQLAIPDEIFRRVVTDALTELTGQTYGQDIVRWRSWWERHKDISEGKWLAERLAYQGSRSRRLEGELDKARTQIVSLHQQLYKRLPAGDRLNHVQSLTEADDPAVRNLAVGWCVELLAGAESVSQQSLAELLMKLTRDGNQDVERSAVLALGQVKDARACEQLRTLLQKGTASIRAAAARALAQQAKGTDAMALARQRKIVPALQKALDDSELEVVVEAAESLGTLGVPEAGAVLTVLLRHPSQPVRQTAALALERVADASSLDGLLAALNDPASNIRFSLVGAIGHAVGDAHGLSEPTRNQILMRLETLLVRDADPGVRSRAASVLGECGSTAILPALWKRVLDTEDNRVQEKAWLAIVEIIGRFGNLDLLKEWDRIIVETGQGQRRLQLLTEIASRWQKRDELKTQRSAVLETLVHAQLEQGKWQAALPILHELLSHTEEKSAVDLRLSWLLTCGQQALRDGKRTDAQHIVEEAQPYLVNRTTLTAEFEKLEKTARQ